MNKKALLSVSDKTGIVSLAKVLINNNYTILSTGGTAKILSHSSLPVTLIEDYTGFPEILDGRVKTLQPKIHAGILANRKIESHLLKMQKMGFSLIDIVVVNLYPFEKVIENEKTTLEEAIENIDIGGITLIRAAAKNFESVLVICDPEDYETVKEELNTKKEISLSLRKKMAVKAFQITSHYDQVIQEYLAKKLQ